MASDVISRDTAARFVDIGKVRDHRLAFTRASKTRRGRAADLVPAPGMVTWGVLYELSDEDALVLDRKEGHPRAYERIEIDVEVGRKPRRCETYVVVDKVWPEQKPQPDYLEDLLRGAEEPRGAEERRLPYSYRRFLKSLGAEPEDSFRQGHLILPTEEVERRSLGIAQVSGSEKRSLRLGDQAVVEVGNRRCVVRVLVDDDLPPEHCRLDQNVRNAVGVLGQFTYGSTAVLHPCADRTLRWSLIRPRFLVLPVAVPARLDSEKNIAVLHPKNISLLGLAEGDYVRIRTAIQDPTGRHLTKAITMRTFTGLIRDSQRGAPETEYPRLTEIYIDADGRRKLGLAAHERGAPVVVTADVRKLFLSRILFYGLTYFVGIAGLAATTRVILDWLRGDDSSDALVYLIAAVLAGLLTATLALVDIRSRVQS